MWTPVARKLRRKVFEAFRNGDIFRDAAEAWQSKAGIPNQRWECRLLFQLHRGGHPALLSIFLFAINLFDMIIQNPP